MRNKGSVTNSLSGRPRLGKQRLQHSLTLDHTFLLVCDYIFKRKSAEGR